MYQRILVPTDGSALSAVAVDAAIVFAQACGSELVALSVVQPEPVVPLAEGAIVTSTVGADVLLEQAEAQVAQVAQAAARAGVRCRTLTRYGYSPADEIVEVAGSEGCDLIFMASHGRRGLSRLLAGSVTQHVLAYSSVPVMVYRPRQTGGRHAPERPAGT